MMMQSLHGFNPPAKFLACVGVQGRTPTGVKVCYRDSYKISLQVPRLWSPPCSIRGAWTLSVSTAIKGRLQQVQYNNILVPKLCKYRDMACWMGIGSHDRESAQDLPSDRTEFLEAAQNGNFVPIFKAVYFHQLTPLLAYQLLVKEDEPGAQSFLFDAAEQGKSSTPLGQFSSLGAQPALEIIGKGNNLTILNNKDGSREERVVSDPLNESRRISSLWKLVMVNRLPETFCGGWVGQFSYGTLTDEERYKLQFKSTLDHNAKRGLPEIHLGFYKDVLVFDHTSKLVYAIHWVELEQFENVEDAYDDGKLRLSLLLDRL